MWNARYWNPRYWAARYWAKAGADPVVPVFSDISITGRVIAPEILGSFKALSIDGLVKGLEIKGHVK